MAGTARSPERPTGAAGRSPRAARTNASRARRSRAAPPARVVAPPRPRLRRSSLTARAAILAVAVASVALALALPFKVWLGQRNQISSLQAQTRQQEQQVADLQHEAQRWNDPAYIQQQARVRLHYAMPGEKTYVVLGKPQAHHRQTSATRTGPLLQGPWYSRLWQSLEAAGKS